VIEGMENIDQINKGEPPASPDAIVSAKIAADA
jgi:peptidylprolyl isomerase